MCRVESVQSGECGNTDLIVLGGVWHAVENFEGPQLQSMFPRVVIERDPVVASVCVCVCVCGYIKATKEI